jgi:hypothetical protein
VVDYLGASFSTGRAGALLLVEHSNSRVSHMAGPPRTSTAGLALTSGGRAWAHPMPGEEVQQSGQRPLSAALGVLAPCRCETQPVVRQ